MKIIVIVVAFFFAVVSLSSCTQTYTCGRQCYVFNNGTIKICQTSAAEALVFAQSVDSLSQLYGSGTNVFADSVTVTGNSENAVNTITLELEQQGYTCNLNTP